MSSATLAKMPPAILATSGENIENTTNAFVINLVSSTTPVALIRPDHAGLKRFNFFVSRRREEGRERFRLHMGYFNTQEEAENLLDIVRTIYPGAWAGLAPGRRLGAAAAAAATEAAASAERQPATSAPAASAESEVAKPLIGEPATPVSVPVAIEPPALMAAAKIEASKVETPKIEAPQVGAEKIDAARVEAIAKREATAKLALVPDEGRRPLTDLGDAPPATQRADAPTVQMRSVSVKNAEAPYAAEHRAARNSLSNIRAAIASLEDSGIRSPVLDALPELQPAVIPVARPADSTSQPAALSDTATLRLLESGAATALAGTDTLRSAEPREASSKPALRKVSTAPMTAVASAAPKSVKSSAGDVPPAADRPCYAVQLMWAVQPIDMASVPPLAIFSAYTLYGAEGNRDGRRWYGLRLGFFTDVVSAKQVAQYVRADFSTVSVVPVTIREREQARKATANETASADTNPVMSPSATPAQIGAAAAKPAVTESVSAVRAASGAGKPRARSTSKGQEFAFIEGTEPLAAVGGTATKAAAPTPTRMIGGRPTKGAPGKRVKVRKPGQINANSPVKPKTLEETLEILGANQLQMDDETNASINDSGVRHLRLETRKGRPSKLSRLIGRLSERMGS